MKDAVTIKASVRIIERSEADEEERLVTGVVADPQNVDSYGNIIRENVIREMSYGFMEQFQNTGIDHAKDLEGNPIVLSDQIVIVESWITRDDSEINGVFVPKGAWVMTCRVKDDEIWQGVLAGEYTGYSLEAWCTRVPLGSDVTDG